MSPRGVGTLAYAVRPRVVLKYFGQLCRTLTLLAGVPTLVSFALGEPVYAWRCALVTLACGVAGWFLGRIEVNSPVQTNESLLVIALTFVAAAVLMSWPLAASGLGYLDALFESVSGITTTGLSVVADIEAQSRAFHFIRAWLQWYGGLAIVALSVALVLEPGQIRERVADSAEAPEDVVTGTRVRARRALTVFAALTAAAFVAIWMLGLHPFDALVYTFAAVSTGGFSPHAASLGDVPGAARVAVIVSAFAGAISFTVYWDAVRTGWRRLAGDREMWWLAACCAASAVLLAVAMASAGADTPAAIARHAPLLALSAQTTTGFTTLDIADLDPASKVVLMASMFIGGDRGSTAGGIKLLRFIIMLRLLHLLVQRASLARHAVIDVRVAGVQYTPEQWQTALSIVLLYVLAIAVTWFPFLLLGHQPLDALFEVVSAMGTVGLSTGVASPGLQPFLKLVLCLDMLMGRLEVVAMLLLIYPRTWFGPRLAAR